MRKGNSQGSPPIIFFLYKSIGGTILPKLKKVQALDPNNIIHPQTKAQK